MSVSKYILATPAVKTAAQVIHVTALSIFTAVETNTRELEISASCINLCETFYNQGRRTCKRRQQQAQLVLDRLTV